ncbi:MAG: hypothetical protein KKI09_04050 [Spirochaetes bacterium]|nr:hypothetical protein [Spirochaetota bacterium]
MQQSGFELINGSMFYTIAGAERLPEFFMSLVSSGDHWMFISSKGALTAGLGNAERALFPYETVDKVMAGRTGTGACTRIRVQGRSGLALWEPSSDWSQAVWPVERYLSKNCTGSELRFEERNLELGLNFYCSWSFSHRHGFVRRAGLRNVGSEALRLQVADGFLNLMNGGVSRRLQSQLSCLTDAYKDNVLDEAIGLAAFSLASMITDRAEPRESLTATVAWHYGLPQARISLTRASLDDDSVESGNFSSRVTGKKSDFIVHATLFLEPGEQQEWYTVADVGLDHAAVSELQAWLQDDAEPIPRQLALESGHIQQELERIICSADGLSVSAQTMHEWHHAANTLFNVMRGGFPVNGMVLALADVINFFRCRNKAAAELLVDMLQQQAAGKNFCTRAELTRWAAGFGNADLVRLANEYLPFTFSRRHGDPSRPWNEFSIKVQDPAGRPLLDYQGNWRDIFQNWEALGQSYPGYLEGFISIFLDATTIDGYNPYRISRSGIDWEREEADDPWSNIGYWNDHQIIYLQKLVEALEAHYPGRLKERLESRIYSWAQVPYRIVSYKELCMNPRASIRFDHELDAQISRRVGEFGTDGRLIADSSGAVLHANLAEKLVSLFAAKLGNFVPGGGIWMNTQRPEWNDANNALAGFGLSMVSVMYVRRALAWWLDLVAAAGCETITLAEPLAQLLRQQQAAMTEFSKYDCIGDGQKRKAFMDTMGLALEVYRDTAYNSLPAFEHNVDLAAADLLGWLQTALHLLDQTIAAARRADGLFESYCLLKFSEVVGSDSGAATVTSLYPMLEGQVAALSSGLLSAEDAVALMQTLRSGSLYCERRKTWLLYPEKVLPDFFTKNRCAEAMLAEAALAEGGLAAELLNRGRRDILYRDRDGSIRFAAGMQNAEELAATLYELAADPQWQVLVAADRQRLLDLYESCFRHSGFTGRSGAMYAYEGLGSVYWHMVAKLMVALAEIRQQYVLDRMEAGDDTATSASLDAENTVLAGIDKAYMMVREGIGYRKSVAEWGAFPFDPYSHTPKSGGAQQPGMTGQVKEELLTRYAEFGLAIVDGCIQVLPTSLLDGEFLHEARLFEYVDAAGKPSSLQVFAGEAACTLAQVPFVRDSIHGTVRVTVRLQDGAVLEFGSVLSRDVSTAIFNRDNYVVSVKVSGGITKRIM